MLLARASTVSLVLLAGCVQTHTPAVESSIGFAVNSAKAKQTISPDASSNVDPVSGIGGGPAYESIQRYHNTFKAPPPTFVVIPGAAAAAGAQ